MNEKRKKLVSLALTLTMTAASLVSLVGCDRTESSGSGPAVVDTQNSPTVRNTEETQGVSEIFPGLDFSEKKGAPVLSDIIWLEGYPDYHDYFEGVKLFIEEPSDGTKRLRDYSGNVLGEYDDIDLYPGFSEGFAAVKKDGKWGYIDTTGQVVIPLKYDDVEDFSDGLAWVLYKNGKWGRIDTTGEFVVPPTFDDGDYITIGGAYSQCFIDAKDKIVIPMNDDDEFDFNEDGLAIVHGNGGYGCCDTTGLLVIPTELSDMHYYSDGLFLVTKDDKFGYIDTTGQVVVPLEYDGLRPFSEGLAWAIKDGKMGCVNTQGQVVIPLEYDYDDASGFKNGLSIVETHGHGRYSNEVGRTYGIVDTTGQVVTPLCCRKVIPLSNGYLCVEAPYNGFRIGTFDYLLGLEETESVRVQQLLIDSKGQVVMPLNNIIIRSFYEGHAVVKKDGTWSVIDTTGTIVRSLEYNEIGNFHEGLAKVERDGKWGYIDYEGRIVIPLEYDEAEDFSEDGFAEVMKDSYVYKIDTKGQILDSMDLSDWLESSGYSELLAIAGFHEGLAKIEQDGKYGYTGINGEVVIPVEYDEAEDFSGGFARVRKDEKYGLIDTKGAIVVPLEYDEVGRFSEGLARVRKDGKYGLIDTKGEIVVPLEYDEVGRFSEGLVMVEKDEEWGYLDTKGQIVIALEYDEVDDFSEGLAAVCKYGDWGYIDTTGQIVIPLEYDRAKPFTEGFAIVRKDDKYGMIDTNETLLLPLEYEDDEDIKIAKNGELIFVRKGESWGFCTVTWP